MSDIGLQFVAEINVFRKSSYPYFPLKPDDLSRSMHLHKPRSTTLWCPIPAAAVNMPRFIAPLESYWFRWSRWSYRPHKHLNLNSPKTQKPKTLAMSCAYFDNRAKRAFQHRKDLAGSSPKSIRLYTSSLPCLERYGKYWFVRFQLTQDPGCSWLRRHHMLFLRPKG